MGDADAAATAAEQAYIDARDGEADAETVARLRQEAIAAQQVFASRLRAAEDARSKADTTRNLVKSLHAQFALASGLEVSAEDAAHAITHAQEAVNAAENALAEAGADATAAEQAYVDARDGDADADTVARLRQEAIAAQQAFSEVREATGETRELFGSIISQMAGRLTREQVREALTDAEHTPLSVINSVLSGPVTAEGIALLQSYAANEEVAGQTITLTNPDGSTVETTVGDYLNDQVLPSYRAQHAVIQGDPAQDKEILDSLAEGTAAAKKNLDRAQAAHDANPTGENRAALDAARRAYDIASEVEDSARAVEHNTNLAASLGLPATATGAEINAEIERLKQPGAEPRPGSDAAVTQSYLTKIDDLRTQPTSNENYNRLGYLSNDPQAHNLTVTWDGEEMSLADYIRDVVRPMYWDRLRIHTSNDESDEQFINELATETSNAKQALDDAVNTLNGDPMNEDLKAAVDAARAAYKTAYDREQRVRGIDRNEAIREQNSELAVSLGLPANASVEQINNAITEQNAQALSEFAQSLGLPADATRAQVDAEVARVNNGGAPIAGSPLALEHQERVAAYETGLEHTAAVDSFVSRLSWLNYNVGGQANRGDERYGSQEGITQAEGDLAALREQYPELAATFDIIQEEMGERAVGQFGRDAGHPWDALEKALHDLARRGEATPESIAALVNEWKGVKDTADGSLRNDGSNADYYGVAYDAKTGQFTRTEEWDEDDDNGGIASGGATPVTEYTINDDGTVSYRDPDSGLTYRVNDDDLADDVRSGNLSLSSAYTIADSAGNVIATNVPEPGDSMPGVPPAIAVGDVVSAEVAEWLNAPHLEGRVITDIEPNEQGGQNIYTRTADAPALSGLEADEVGDPAQAQRESTIVTQWQAAQLGNPELEGYVKHAATDEDGNPQVILVPPPNRQTEDEQRLVNARDIDPLGDDLAIDHNAVNAAALLDAADDYGIRYDPKRPDWDGIALQVQRHQETAAAVAYEDGVTPYYEGAKETGVQKRERLLAMGADITDPDDHGYIYEGPRMTGLQMERLLLQDGVGTGGIGDAAVQAQIHQQQQQSLAASIPDESAITRADELATQNLLDQGYETWGGAFVRYLDEDGNPVSSADEAFYRIHAEKTFTGFDENGVSEYRTELQLQERNQGVTAWVEGADEWKDTGLHPAELEGPYGLPTLGRSDQNIAAETQYSKLSGRWVDMNGVLELPDQQRVFERPNTRHGMGTIQQVEMRGVPLDYVVGVNPDGTVQLRDGWEDAVVPMHPDRTRVAGLNPDGTLETEGGTAWHVAKPWVSAVPGAGTLITAYDIQHPSSAEGEDITGREWRQLGSAATVDSVYLFGFPHGAANLGRGLGTAAIRGSAGGAWRTAVRAPRTLLYDASLPVVAKEVGRQGLTIVRNPVASFRGSGRPTLRGLRNEFGEEFLVEYPIETLAPHAWRVGEKPLITGGEDGILSYRPGSAWELSPRQQLLMAGFAGSFGTLEGAGRRRALVSTGGNTPSVAITPDSNPNPTNVRFRHHSATEPTEGFNVGQPYDAWPADLVDMRFGHRTSSGLLTPQPTLPSGYTLSKSNIIVPGPGAPRPVVPTTGLMTPSSATPVHIRRTATPTPNPDPVPAPIKPAAPTASADQSSDAGTSDPAGNGDTVPTSSTPARAAAGYSSPTSTPGTLSPTPSASSPTTTPGPSSPAPTPQQSQSTQTGPSTDPHTPNPQGSDPHTPNPQGEDPFTPDPSDPDAPTPDPGVPQPGTPTPGAPTPGGPTPGTPGPGTPTPGTPGPGTPTPGTPSPGTPTAGSPSPTTPESTTPDSGTPGKPTSTPGKPDPKRPSPTTTTSPTSTPSPDKEKQDNVRRREIANPVANDPEVNPREIEFIEEVKHTVDTVTGEHTVEPADDRQLRSARIVSYSAENPEGNVLEAGSLVIEVNPDHIELESATRQKDASAAAPATSGQTGPTAEQLEAMQAHYSNYLAGQRDNSGQAENGRTGPTDEQRAKMQEHFRAHNTTGERPPIRMQGDVSRPNAQQMAEVQRRYKQQQSGASKGKSGKNRPPIKVQKGYQANTGSKSQRPPIKYLPGQGPAKKPDPYAGLMGGGGGARRGGGKRRPTEQELEERRRRMGSPKIELVIRS